VDVNTSKLTRIAPLTNSLWVVPASEVSHWKITSLEEAQRVLNVNLAVTGRVICYGDTVNMTVDLFDTKRLRRLKHFTVSEPMANLSTWQDSLIMHMTRMLEVKLEPAKYSFLKVGCSSVPSAYRSYLRGCGYLASFALGPQVDSAIVAFNQAIAEDPSFAQAYVAMGEAYWRRGYAAKATGLIERAIICCDQAIKLNDQLPGAFSLRGKCEAQTHQYDNAIRDFGRAVQLDSDCFEAYEGMGKTYYDSSKYDLAAGAYWEAVRVRPESYSTYYWLGKAYIDNGEYDKAIKPFEAMIELRPRQAHGYGYLGYVYFNKDNWPEAEKMFLKSLALDTPGTLGYVRSDLATIYFYEGRYADAAALCKKGLEKVLEKPIDYSKEFRSVGMYAEFCYWTPGQRDSSLALFQTATNMAEKQLAENPDDAGILAYLASYHSMMGNRAKAQAYLNEAESRAPTDKDVAFRIGETYEQLGERERALVWIGKALDSGLPLTYVELPPGLSSLRSDERFPRLRQTYRLRDRR
jgi:tetratricopeptide (TPR) repeat protein